MKSKDFLSDADASSGEDVWYHDQPLQQQPPPICLSIK